MRVHFPFDNSYARLPDGFYAAVAPAPVPAPQLLALNEDLARKLGLDPDALASGEGVAILAGLRLPAGAEPLAMAYAGHQFGQFVPRLGDGRAILLGELVDRDGVRRDIQLKGAGPTPFSRRGDGRAALGPVLREYMVSEAMAALAIPTTRALAAVATGDVVLRETPLPGAVLTRVAKSHVRVGTFQYFAARGDAQALQLLARYVVNRLNLRPLASDTPGADNPALVLLDNVVARQARLIALWLMVGFVHGVMNTDNMSVAGETIDYGPCAFLDVYDPKAVFSSIDQFARYAYGNQPAIAAWNLARFAESLLAVLDPQPERALALAQDAVGRFKVLFDDAFHDGFARKLGLVSNRDEDAALIHDWLAAMAAGAADFTLAFRRLSLAIEAENEDKERALGAAFADPAPLAAWLPRWRARLSRQDMPLHEVRAAMNAVNPAYIARNHLVEAALDDAVEKGDLTRFHALNAVLSKPYEDQPGQEAFAEPPSRDAPAYRTFCGT